MAPRLFLRIACHAFFARSCGLCWCGRLCSLGTGHNDSETGEADTAAGPGARRTVMADPTDEKQTPDSAAQAKVAENEAAVHTSTPDIEPPDEHSPDIAVMGE